MPVSCSQSVLTGADGLITFSPAGTKVCLEKPDMPSGDAITVGAASFRVNDPVTLTYPAGSTEDSTLAAGDYFILDVDSSAGTVKVSATEGGSAITLTGDVAFAAGTHAELAYTGTEAICSVSEWALNLSKDQTDVTTLPCSISTSGGGKVAPVRKQQGTFLNGEGSMSVMFSGDTTSPGMRLLQDSIKTDSKVYAKLYINAVGGAGGAVDDTASMYYAGWVNLLGFSITVNTSDAIVAEVNFSVAEQPDAIFGVVL